MFFIKYLKITSLEKSMVIDKNSRAYNVGRIVGKIILVIGGYILGKRWSRQPIDRGFPERK